MTLFQAGQKSACELGAEQQAAATSSVEAALRFAAGGAFDVRSSSGERCGERAVPVFVLLRVVRHHNRSGHEDLPPCRAPGSHSSTQKNLLSFRPSWSSPSWLFFRQTLLAFTSFTIQQGLGPGSSANVPAASPGDMFHGVQMFPYTLSFPPPRNLSRGCCSYAARSSLSENDPDVGGARRRATYRSIFVLGCCCLA